MRRLAWRLAAVLGAAPGALAAQDARLTVDLPQVNFTLNGRNLTIARAADPTARLTGEFARTARACPPFCVQPMTVTPGVATLGELEVIAFLQEDVSGGTGLLIDARLPEMTVDGTIPGAVNVPFATLDPANPYRDEILSALGAVPSDFDGALDLVVFCSGPWSDQSARLIGFLIDAGYPPGRIRWYRGGMQDWLILGLTTASPDGAD